MNNHAPTQEEAKLLGFADLARIVRAHLDIAPSPIDCGVSEQTIRSWIEILESKIPRLPEKPQGLEFPDPPVIPEEPRVEEPVHSASPHYQNVENQYVRLIASLRSQMNGLGKKKRKPIKKRIGELQAEQQKALFEAKVADLKEDVAERWLQQRSQHEQWRRLKQKLDSEHQARVTHIVRQNRGRQKKWSYDVELWRNSHAVPLRIVHNLRRDLATFRCPSPQFDAIRLSWRLLPSSETGEERVISYLRDFHRRCPEIRVDESRLRHAYSLKPEKIFIGEDEFDGYFAFVFAGGNKVLLENPIEGNAAYIFGQDWRILSKLSKSELLVYHRDRLVRIIHSPSWKSDIKQVLRRFRG